MSTNNFPSLNIIKFKSNFLYPIILFFLRLNKKLNFYYLNIVHQKSNCLSFHAPEIPSISYKVKKIQFFELRFVPSYATHQKTIKKF